MKKAFVPLLLFGLLIVASCAEDAVGVARAGTGNTPSTPEWLIPVSSVVDGGTGKDGIPSIDNPKFRPAREIESIPDWEFVIALKLGEEIRVYPHNIMNWHEIVNDQILGELFAVTYCPLTGTTLVWDSQEETTFGVSGLLYNSNLIPYDRRSGSYWSQMLNQSVSGARSGQTTLTLPAVEVRWGELKEDYPEARVLTTDTGFDRNYNSYPYGTYRTNDNLLFPISRRDNRIFLKDRVHGVQMGGITRVYQFSDFEERSYLVDQIAGSYIVVLGNLQLGAITSFFIQPEMAEEGFWSSASSPSPDAIVTDSLGNTYNLFGEVVSGPNEGSELNATPSYMGFYFAWAAFNDLEIYGR